MNRVNVVDNCPVSFVYDRVLELMNIARASGNVFRRGLYLLTDKQIERHTGRQADMLIDRQKDRQTIKRGTWAGRGGALVATMTGGRGFESRSSRRVGTLCKSFTRSFLWRF